MSDFSRYLPGLLIMKQTEKRGYADSGVSSLLIPGKDLSIQSVQDLRKELFFPAHDLWHIKDMLALR